ncbi:MAG: hypothetical protein J5871_04315 [Bacteroidales bacterium]|nr:hypothetical protein [Bacteroidales bacterium]
MDYSGKIKDVQGRIAELKRIKDALYQIEDSVYGIEKEVSRIDEALPDDGTVAAMPAGAEKEQLLHLFDILNQAYDLIDELLGPAEDDNASGQETRAYSPEARGNTGREISLEEVLKQIQAGGKNNAS